LFEINLLPTGRFRSKGNLMEKFLMLRGREVEMINISLQEPEIESTGTNKSFYFEGL
jgi:hypothetical protein